MDYETGDVNAHAMGADSQVLPVGGGAPTSQGAIPLGFEPTSLPASKPFYRRWKVIAGAAVVLLAVLIANRGSGSSSPDYHDPDTLAQQIKDNMISRMNDPNDKASQLGLTVDDVSCLEVNRPQYECIATFSDGTHLNAKVTVSDDGSQYISASDN